MAALVTGRARNEYEMFTVLKIAKLCLIRINDALAKEFGIIDEDNISQVPDRTNTIRCIFTGNKVRRKRNDTLVTVTGYYVFHSGCSSKAAIEGL